MLPILLPPPAVTITSPLSGNVIRSRAVIVRGTSWAAEVSISASGSRAVRVPTVEGRFAAPIELKDGDVQISVGDTHSKAETRISCKPATSGCKVRLVYLDAADESEPSVFGLTGTKRVDVQTRFSTAAKLMQAFCEDHFRRTERVSRTFTLDFGRDGHVPISFLKSSQTGAELRAQKAEVTWSKVYAELQPKFKTDQEKLLVVMGFTRYDAATQTTTGATALGGGSLALFGGGCVRFWPTSVADSVRAFSDNRVIDPKVELDDSGLRYRAWANSSTTIGAMMHELGHTFGLPHSIDNRCIMSRGFDQFSAALIGFEPGLKEDRRATPPSYWDPVHSARLSLSPFFQPRRPASEKPIKPKLVLKGDTLAADSADELRLISVWQDGKPNWMQNLSGKRAEFSLRELRGKIGGDKVNIVVTTQSGGEDSVRL
ncbi:MAG: hypothetical protein WCK51_07965 [Armatimonadota bacterium]